MKQFHNEAPNPYLSEHGEGGDIQALLDAKTGAEFLMAWLANDILTPAAYKKLHKYYRRFDLAKSPRLQHWYGEQIREAEAIIDDQPGLRVLEVGSGCGTESLWFAMREARVIGLEPSPAFVSLSEERKQILERAIGRKLDCRFVCDPLHNYSPPEGFDLIWMEQAYHHCEPRSGVVSQVANLLNSGGHLIIVEANALNPLLQLQLFRQRGFKTIVAQKDKNGEPYLVGNERITTSFDIARVFAKQEIERKSVRFFRLFPSGARFEILFPIERLVPDEWPLPFFTHFVYVGQKSDHQGNIRNSS